jgi:hypothetical protein
MTGIGELPQPVDRYAASKGLTYPMKSSVVRGMLASVKAIQGASLLLTLDVAMIQALGTELIAAWKGGCRAFCGER